MHPTDQAANDDLSTRLDELQDRVEHLEYLLMGESETEAVASDGGFDAVPEGVPSESHDLRTLQRAATADLDTPHATAAFTQRSTHDDAPTLPKIDLAYVEERLAGRALAVVGGVALILGAVFFLSLAFSRG